MESILAFYLLLDGYSLGMALPLETAFESFGLEE
jgi:hypothetical protein